MSAILETLVCWIRWAVQTGASYIVDGIHFVLLAIVGAVNIVLGLLPTVDLGSKPSPAGGALGILNYVLPVGTIISEFGLILACWIIYRLYQWLLKFAHAGD